MNKEVTLLSDTNDQLTVTGQQQKADGFFGFTDGFHTVGFYLNNFVGRLFIQASLAENPTDDDWFNVVLDGETSEFLQYDNNTDGLIVKNFKGNFIWVRARVDRSYINPPPGEPFTNTVGRIMKILMVR